MIFSVMDSPKNVMQVRLRPAQDEKPIFCHDFFVIEVGAHHIYDDTWFCHSYRHRSVISMTGKKFVRPIMSRMCLFCSDIFRKIIKKATCGNARNTQGQKKKEEADNGLAH